MKYFYAALLSIMMMLLSSSSSFAQQITVAAAANLQFALDELAQTFENQSTIKIVKVIGSSGKLTAQIENGAPFDLFLSADLDFPQRLADKNLTVHQPSIYAYGALVLWTMRHDLELTIKTLADPRVEKIAIADPKTAPYGKQAIKAIEYFALYPAVEKKLIYGESIAQVNQFISTSSVDVGLTAKSTVMADNMRGQGYWVEIDPSTYEPIAQAGVILKYAKGDALAAARSFLDFILSPAGQTILRKYGYTSP